MTSGYATSYLVDRSGWRSWPGAERRLPRTGMPETPIYPEA